MPNGVVLRYDTFFSVDAMTPAGCSNGYFRCATISACCRKSITRRQRLLGNFPQASPSALINTAHHIARPVKSCEQRSGHFSPPEAAE